MAKKVRKGAVAAKKHIKAKAHAAKRHVKPPVKHVKMAAPKPVAAKPVLSKPAAERPAHEAGPIKWAGAVRKSLRFGIEPKRWLPFFVIDALALIAILLVASSTTTLFSQMYYPQPQMTAGEYALLGEIILAVILWALVNIWITGAVIHQSYSHRDFKKSWDVSLRKYPSLLGAVIIAGIPPIFLGILSFLLSMVPYIGFVFSILVSVAFLFVNQYIIIDGRGFVDALRDSARTFWGVPLKTFMAWLLAVVMSLVILLIFAIPLLADFAYHISAFGAQTFKDAVVYMLLYTDTSVLYALGAILLLGFSITRAFGLKLLTDIYLQMKSRKMTV
jgi:hypothetical protein